MSAGADNNTIENNVFSSNGMAGIFIEGCRNNKIEKNSITDNPVGIKVSKTSENNPVHNNNIVGNIKGIINEADVPVDATLNWWGTTDGSKIASMVSGPVEYEPWLDTPAPGQKQPRPGRKIAGTLRFLNDIRILKIFHY